MKPGPCGHSQAGHEKTNKTKDKASFRSVHLSSSRLVSELPNAHFCEDKKDKKHKKDKKRSLDPEQTGHEAAGSHENEQTVP